MKLLAAIFASLVAFSVLAEEQMNALQTALSGTTISGYVDTSIEWADNDYSAPMTHPQVPVDGLAAIPNWGADFLHSFVRKGFVSTDGRAGTGSFVELKVQRQGAFDRQQCLLRLRRLVPLQTHTLLAARIGDAEPVTVAQFKTDPAGAATFLYKNGPVSGTAAALPESLVPLARVRGFVVTDAGGQPLLVADLAQPDQLQHFARKRMASFYGVGGQAHVYGARKKSILRVEALNLMPDNTYLLGLNGVTVGGTQSDERGHLRLAGQLNPGATPVYLQSVELGGTNLVSLLRAEFP
jgi:hypothetical protein